MILSTTPKSSGTSVRSLAANSSGRARTRLTLSASLTMSRDEDSRQSNACVAEGSVREELWLNAGGRWHRVSGHDTLCMLSEIQTNAQLTSPCATNDDSHTREAGWEIKTATQPKVVRYGKEQAATTCQWTPHATSSTPWPSSRKRLIAAKPLAQLEYTYREPKLAP